MHICEYSCVIRLYHTPAAIQTFYFLYIWIMVRRPLPILKLLISTNLLESSSPSSSGSGSSGSVGGGSSSSLLLFSSFSVKCRFVLQTCWDETLEPACFYGKLINLSMRRPARLWLAVQQRDQKSIWQQLEQDREKQQAAQERDSSNTGFTRTTLVFAPRTLDGGGSGGGKKKWLERCRRSAETLPGVPPLVCPLAKDFVRRFLNDKTESGEVYLPGHTHRRVQRNNLEPECEDGSWKIWRERGWFNALVGLMQVPFECASHQTATSTLRGQNRKGGKK